MSKAEIAPFVLAGVGGLGAMVSALAWMDMADALNRNRPADDQIPTIATSLRELERRGEPRFRQWRIAREFRRAYPTSSAYAWYFGGTVWCCVFMLISFILFFFVH